jgi:hypothetical protein
MGDIGCYVQAESCCSNSARTRSDVFSQLATANLRLHRTAPFSYHFANRTYTIVVSASNNHLAQ